MASGPTIGATALILTTDNQQFNKGLDSAGKQFKSFRQRVEADAKGLTSGLKEAFGHLMSPVGVIGGIAGAGIAGFSLGSIVTDSVKLAAEMEDTAAWFKVVVGDAKRGDSLFREIENSADAMRISIREAADAARQLMAADVGEDVLVPTLRMLGDLAGGDAEKLKTIANAYAKVRDEGIVTSRTLRAFQGAGVFLGPELAKGLGTDRDGLRKMLDEERVTFRDLQSAIIAATSAGGKFFGLIDARAETMKGKIDAIANAWDDFKWKLGEIIIDEFGLKGVFDGIANAIRRGEGGLDDMRPFLRELVESGKTFAKAIASAAMSMAIAAAKLADSVGSLDRRGKQIGVIFEGSTQFERWLGGKPEDAGGAERAVRAAKEELDKILDQIGKAGTPADIAMTGRQAAEAIAQTLLNASLRAIDKLKRDAAILADQAKHASEADRKKLESIRERLDPAYKLDKEMTELREMYKRGAFAGKENIFRQEQDRILAERDRLKAGKDIEIRNPSVELKDSREAISSIIESQTRAMMGDKQNPALDVAKQQRDIADDSKNLLQQITDILNQIKIPEAF